MKEGVQLAPRDAAAAAAAAGPGGRGGPAAAVAAERARRGGQRAGGHDERGEELHRVAAEPAAARLRAEERAARAVQGHAPPDARRGAEADFH